MEAMRVRRTAWRLGLVPFLLLVAAAIVLSGPLFGALSAPGWSTPQDISHTTWGSYGPDLVFDSQGYSHAVWYGDAEVSTNWGIWYANNRSGTWSTPVKIVTNVNLQSPEIAIDPADGLHVVYEDWDTKEIMYAYSSNYGQTWSETNISNSPGNAYEPAITVDADGNVHAVWIDNRWTGDYQVTYARRTNGTWSAPVRVQTSVQFNKAPRIVTTGSGSDLRVHIVFYGGPSGAPNTDYELYYVRGTGTSWEPARNLSQTPGSRTYDPDIAAVGTALYVVWDEAPGTIANHDIKLLRSTDNGSTWLPRLDVTADTARSRFPNTAFGQGKDHIVYDSDLLAPNYGDIYYVTYDPAAGQFSSPLNLSTTSGDSQLATVVVNPCRVAVVWQDKGTKWNVLYTTTPDTPPGPCEPTVTPTATPSPSPTPNPNPHGYVQIYAHDPYSSTAYTRLLTVTLHLSATSDVGAQITDMAICNLGDCPPTPVWIPFLPVTYNWPLLATQYDCEWKSVIARFRDEHGRESIPYGDFIQYDNYVTASMVLNDGQPYARGSVTNPLVMVTSEDLDSQQPDCTGLRDMRLWEEGLTQTVWISYYPRLYFFLAPGDQVTRTVYAEYRDRANNVGVFSDSILLDFNAPYSGTPPTLNNGVPTTTHLLIPVTGLEAQDDESGVAYVWFANDAGGPWMRFPYSGPSAVYTWNLAYGGPPIQYPDLHRVYVRYEDGSGFGSYPGNLSQVYSATISVSGISNIYLPLVLRARAGLGQGTMSVAGDAVRLVLVSDPERALPGEDVLLWMAAWRDDPKPVEGQFRLTLPQGLHLVRAWSAYGEIVSTDGGTIVSRERASARQVPWILVHARVDAAPPQVVEVRGEMVGPAGTVSAVPVRVRTR